MGGKDGAGRWRWGGEREMGGKGDGSERRKIPKINFLVGCGCCKLIAIDALNCIFRKKEINCFVKALRANYPRKRKEGTYSWGNCMVRIEYLR